MPHLIPLNSTQTPRHLLSHHVRRWTSEFERRVCCRSQESTCEGLRRWCTVGGRCKSPNQLFLNHLPPPSIPTALAWCPDLTIVLQVLGALEKRFWRPGATRSREIAPDTKVHPPPPASQPDHLRWCWLVFCDPPSPPLPDRSLSCLCLQVFEDSKSEALKGRGGQHFGGLWRCLGGI